MVLILLASLIMVSDRLVKSRSSNVLKDNLNSLKSLTLTSARMQLYGTLTKNSSDCHPRCTLSNLTLSNETFLHWQSPVESIMFGKAWTMRRVFRNSTNERILEISCKLTFLYSAVVWILLARAKASLFVFFLCSFSRKSLSFFDCTLTSKICFSNFSSCLFNSASLYLLSFSSIFAKSS